MSARVLRLDLAAGIGLAALAGSFFYFRIITTAHEMYFAASNDPYTQIYPMVQLADRWLRAGHVPLWNPYQFCGHPFLAAVSYGVTYPLNLLFLLVPTRVGLELKAALHLFLAGLFCYSYGRTIKLSRASASLAAVVFMLSGFVTSQALWFTPAIEAIAWLPLGFLAIEKIFERPRFKWAVLLSLAVAMPILAGWLQTWTYSMHAIGAYCAFRMVHGVAVGRDWRLVLRAGGAVAGGIVLGLSLSAIQLLPSLELQSLGPRRPGGLSLEQTLSLGPVPPVKILSETFDSRSGFPRQSYIGIVSLVLIPLSLVAVRRRHHVVFLWLLGAWSLLIAMTTYTPLFAVFRAIPGGSWFRIPWRVVLLFAFAGAVLSGEAVEVALRSRRSALLALVPFLTALLWWSAVAMPERSRGLLWLGAAVICGMVLTGRHAARVAGIVALISISMWDMFFATESPALHPYHDLKIYDQEAAALDYISANQGLARTYIHFSMPGNPPVMPKQGTLRGIFSITDYEPLSLDRFARVYHAIEARRSDGSDPKDLPFIGFLELDPTPDNLRLLDLMSVRFIMSHPLDAAFTRKLTTPQSDWRLAFVPRDGGHEFVYENPKALPRAYIVHDWEFAANESDAFVAITSPTFDRFRSAVVEAISGVRAVAALAPPRGLTEVSVASYEPTRVVVRTRDDEPGYLVLTDTFYPGWVAEIDGRPVPIDRGNYLFRAVYVPGGPHTVTFDYRPNTFLIGVIVSLSASVLVCVGLVRTRSRKAQSMRSAVVG
ncbi:MAG: YfhO family protein [Deltaproteobacteria bacterium]|nr:YfhO family protein [Deltaproteobacteria bacterium]MBI3391486.1 YfhO family protein [Deltaproteobacteria bacterium]